MEFKGLGVFLPALDFFICQLFGVTREKDARLRRCFCASTIVGAKKPARPRRCFFASAYGAKKSRGPEKGVVLPGHGGVFLPAHLSPSASPRRNAVEERRPFVPCEGGRNVEKN